MIEQRDRVARQRVEMQVALRLGRLFLLRRRLNTCANFETTPKSD
jgi:hypothetical protein